MIISLVIQVFLLPIFPPVAVLGYNDTESSQYMSYSRVDPNIAIVVAFLACSFFFVGVFSIFIRQCYEPASSSYPSTAAAAQYLRTTARPIPPRGLKKSVIESFPVLDYNSVKEVKIGEEGLECAICLSAFENHDSLRLLPQCNHVFHPECIDMWLASHVSCPVCRANLEEIAICAPPKAEPPDPQVNEVVVPVDEAEAESRPSARVIAGRFPRSHSTGHSLGGDDRYMLRLPEELRREVVNKARLIRTASFNSYNGILLIGEWSSRKGYKGNSSNGEGSSRGGRWIFARTPPFVSRGVNLLAPLNCLNGKVDGVGEPSFLARPMV